MLEAGHARRAASRVSAFALGFCACCALAAVAACGSSGDDDTQGPSGDSGADGSSSSSSAGTGGGAVGKAGTGGSTSGAQTAGSGGSAAAGSGGNAAPGTGGRNANAGAMSPTEACLAYSTARSARRAECSGDVSATEDSIARHNPDCPDLFLSDGSTRSVANLLDCAEQIRAFPCNETLAQRVPDCVTPGTRAGGEACVFASQCASLRCKGGITTCGTCATRVEAGEACDVSDLICPPNYGCDGGTCVEIPRDPPPPPMMDPPKPTKPTGAECANHGECTGEDLCFPDDNDVLRCKARVALGGNCSASTSYCFDAHYCDTADYECKVLPGKDEPCGVHFGEPSLCAENLSCVKDTTSATCRVRPGLECEVAGLMCPPDSRCCPDCATPTCIRSLLPGEPCDDPLARCIRGTECATGTCKPVESQGLFAELCK